MRLPLVKVGNSLSLRIPRRVLASLGLAEGNGLFLSVEEGRMILSKTPAHPKVAAFMEAIRPLLGKKVHLVYLFGSFVTPKFKADRSDIDLYVIVRDDPAVMRILNLVSGLDIRTGAPPLGPIVLPVKRVDWTWFEDEVLDGVPLYVDRKAFPHGVPPPDYLREMEAERAEVVT